MVCFLAFFSRVYISTGGKYLGLARWRTRQGVGSIPSFAVQGISKISHDAFPTSLGHRATDIIATGTPRSDHLLTQ